MCGGGGGGGGEGGREEELNLTEFKSDEIPVEKKILF